MMSFRKPKLFVPRPTKGVFEQVIKEDNGDYVREVVVMTTEFVAPNIPMYDEYSLPQLLAAGVNVTPVDPTVIPVPTNSDSVSAEIDSVLSSASLDESKEDVNS